MERVNNKRGREGEEAKEYSSKKQQYHHHHHHHHNIDINIEQQHEVAYESSSENYLGLGVFDFPWLKESMISKSVEWSFEDSFSLSLYETCTNTAAASVEFSAQCLSEIPASCMESLDIISFEKFEEMIWSLEMEGVDCTWGSMLNQPLAQK